MTTRSPAEGLVLAELVAKVRRAAHLVGRLRFRIALAYGRYEYEFGKTHGAYVHIARLAVLDGEGRVVNIRPWRTRSDDGLKLAPRIVRQVRLLHREAWEGFGGLGGCPPIG